MTDKLVPLDSPEALEYLSKLFGVMVTYGSQAGIEMNSIKREEVLNDNSTHSNQG